MICSKHLGPVNSSNVTTPSERALWKRQTIYNFWSKLICPKSTTRQTLVEVTDTLFRLQEREAVLDPAPWQWPGGVATSICLGLVASPPEMEEKCKHATQRCRLQLYRPLCTLSQRRENLSQDLGTYIRVLPSRVNLHASCPGIFLRFMAGHFEKSTHGR